MKIRKPHYYYIVGKYNINTYKCKYYNGYKWEPIRYAELYKTAAEAETVRKKRKRQRKNCVVFISKCTRNHKSGLPYYKFNGFTKCNSYQIMHALINE